VTPETSEIVIIGAGLSGAAAAWRLAEAGAEVLVLERDRPASELGSSHGSARIFRYAYPDRASTRLVTESRAGWTELERRSGRRLITPSGALDFGAVRNPHGLARVLEAEGVECELLPRDVAAERWPQMNFDTDVLWHPDAGVIDAESAVSTMLDLAQQAGARVMANWEVAHVEKGGSSGRVGYTVTSFDGRAVDCAQVVVAAGPFLPALLEGLDMPAGFRSRMPEFEVRQETAFHFPYRDFGDTGETECGQAASWPTFIYKGPDIQAYGLPGGRDADFLGQKIAEYNGGRLLRSGYEQDRVIDPAHRKRLIGFVDQVIPGVRAEPYAETTCPFTNVPRDDMIIDRADGITIVSPCSGQGAKFAPVLGELVVDLVLRSGRPQSRFRAAGQRFSTEPPQEDPAPTDAIDLLDQIAEIGVDPERGGYSRPVFSGAELELRRWFIDAALDRDLDTVTDENGVIWAWCEAKPISAGGKGGNEADLESPPTAAARRRKAIVTGSHLDSVPGGGNYDGPLGVASALAAFDDLRSRGVLPAARPFGIAVFPEEEGSRFGVACLGSRLMTGRVSPEAVRELRDKSGRSYAEASVHAGFDPSRIGPTPERLDQVEAFVELHVEQGRKLVDLDQPVALAGSILAHGRWRVSIEGSANHAGTTTMDDRHDPMVVAARIVAEVRNQVLKHEDARGTVGRIQASPGGTNVIASRVDLWIDVRHRESEVARDIVEEIARVLDLAAAEEGCASTMIEESFASEVDFDPQLRARLQSVLPDAPVLDSGAGHDAAALAEAVPTAMLFVRNPTGTSHAPSETVDEVDVLLGQRALTEVLEELLVG
jgi:sarcosine oxidase